MSAIELIFTNPLIVVTMIAGTLILLIALGLLFGGWVQTTLVRRQQQLAQNKALLLTQYEDNSDDTLPAPPSDWIPSEKIIPPRTTTPVPETAPSEPEVAPSAAMQDILSSVFVDESEQQRYNVLLQGHETTNASEVAVLAHTIVTAMKQSGRYGQKGH